MSDMIWNGSYTLGNSQETQITAGTGIKVTTPAAGQIQISNDETVLYTGTHSTSPIVLSEVVTNFEYIEITWEHKSNDLVNNMVYKYRIPTSEFMAFGGRGQSQQTGGFVWFMATWRLGTDNKTMTRWMSRYMTIADTGVGTPTESPNLYPIKVVGINRIAGGN